MVSDNVDMDELFKLFYEDGMDIEEIEHVYLHNDVELVRKVLKEFLRRMEENTRRKNESIVESLAIIYETVKQKLASANDDRERLCIFAYYADLADLPVGSRHEIFEMMSNEIPPTIGSLSTSCVKCNGGSTFKNM